jgi:hypothetical protein
VRSICAILLFFVTPLLAQMHIGVIDGHIVDARTLEPVMGVNIQVVQKPLVGAISDGDGRFEVKGLEVGTYSLRVSSVNYAAQIITNVVVSTGRHTPVAIALEERVIEHGGVTVKADYFSRAQLLAPVSVNALNRAEIRRSPGGIEDVQRVVQSLPGVASSTDNMNELIVRGGAAFENLTVVDHMEIPSINHYSNPFNSAGPINMINADMIEDVQFSAGGFPAQYGDKSASVLNITVREGNRDKRFSASTGFNMAGVGFLGEGGFAHGRGSYIFSARRSLLEMADAIVGISSISLTAVPKYWDTQAKIVYDLSATQKLSFNWLYGHATIDLIGDLEETDKLRKNVTDSSSVETIYPFNAQYVAGLNLRSLWGKRGYSNFTLYTSGWRYDVKVNRDYARQVRGPVGQVLDYEVLNSYPLYENRAREGYTAAKAELYYQPHERHRLNAGMQFQTATSWNNDLFIQADTSRYDLNGDGIFETGPITRPESRYSSRIHFGDASKYYLYASDQFTLTPRWSLTMGVRYDHFTYTGHGAWSPRLSLACKLQPALTTLTLAVGRYPQTPPFPYLGDRLNSGINHHLDYLYADHAVVGLEHILAEGLKFNAEVYYKEYRHTPVSEEFIYQANETLRSERYLAIGERRSYGLEFFLEQKQVKDFYGTLSLSLSKSKEKDPRLPGLVDWYPSEYDYPVVATLIAGKVVRGTHTWLQDAPFFIKYPSMVLPLSNEMEVGFKFRYQTGRPYTPMEFVTWQQRREGQIAWSHGVWKSTTDINAERYPDYYRFDIQWLSRYYYKGWNANVYIAVQNVLNTKNVYYINYRSDGRTEKIYQYAFFPVGGLEIEF